jgi:hypothetical protein
MTPARQISLGLVASLPFATSARAGTFANPFQSSLICGDRAVSASLADADVFASSPHCNALCQKTEGECESFALKILGCYSSWYKTEAA